jgi:hypothetical protein
MIVELTSLFLSQIGETGKYPGGYQALKLTSQRSIRAPGGNVILDCACCDPVSNFSHTPFILSIVTPTIIYHELPSSIPKVSQASL